MCISCICRECFGTYLPIRELKQITKLLRKNINHVALLAKHIA